MGDRIAIQFTSEKWHKDSPVLYSHWGGRSMINAVNKFIKQHGKSLKGSSPGLYMVNFISWLLAGTISRDYDYDLDDGATNMMIEDNGTWIYDVDKEEWC